MFCTCTELNYNQNLCSVLRRLGALFQVIKQWDGHVSAAVYLTRTQLPLLSGNISAQPRHLLANTHIHVVIDDGVSSVTITENYFCFLNKFGRHLSGFVMLRIKLSFCLKTKVSSLHVSVVALNEFLIIIYECGTCRPLGGQHGVSVVSVQWNLLVTAGCLL